MGITRQAAHPPHAVFIDRARAERHYLLLIALSEHLPFWLSYALGALALIALLGSHYIAGALADVRPGVAISVVMSLVYGLLYVLVVSENYSLLVGAIALFGDAGHHIMIVTRELRWGPTDDGV